MTVATDESPHVIWMTTNKNETHGQMRIADDMAEAFYWPELEKGRISHDGKMIRMLCGYIDLGGCANAWDGIAQRCDGCMKEVVNAHAMAETLAAEYRDRQRMVMELRNPRFKIQGKCSPAYVSFCRQNGIALDLADPGQGAEVGAMGYAKTRHAREQLRSIRYAVMRRIGGWSPGAPEDAWEQTSEEAKMALEWIQIAHQTRAVSPVSPALIPAPVPGDHDAS